MGLDWFGSLNRFPVISKYFVPKRSSDMLEK